MLSRVVGVEEQVLVCMCRLPENLHLDGAICLADCQSVQECQRPILLGLSCELDVGIYTIDVGKELFCMFSLLLGVGIIYIPVPPLWWMWSSGEGFGLEVLHI